MIDVKGKAEMYPAAPSSDANIRLVNYGWNRFHRNYYEGPRNHAISVELGGGFNVTSVIA